MKTYTSKTDNLTNKDISSSEQPETLKNQVVESKNKNISHSLNSNDVLINKSNDSHNKTDFQQTEIIQIASNILKYPTKQIKTLISQNEINNYLNKRIELNGYCGTIKYIGALKHKKESDSELWLGIEWDEENRGKHNGTVENYTYFEIKNNKNSGSLVKISKVNFGLDFEEAINFKYNFENQKNEMYTFMSKIVDNEAYIQAKRKRIEIEFVGKEKAIKKYSDYKTFPRIELGNSYLARICDIKADLATFFPNLRELNLTRSLLSKWSEFAMILISLKNLESLNFSENKLMFDDEFYHIKKIIECQENYYFTNIDNEKEDSNKKSLQKDENMNHVESSDDIENESCSVLTKIKQKFSSSSEIKNNLKLKSLILNKNYLYLEDLMKISFLLPSLENLYLFDNHINEQNVQINLSEELVSEFKRNLENLKGLILEKNNISSIEHILCFFPHKNLACINLSQNSIKHLFSKELYESSEQQIQNKTNHDVGEIIKMSNNKILNFNFKDFFENLKILNLDFNAIYDYETLFNQLKYLMNLEELNILNNGFIRNEKLGLENAKVNIIGRLLKLNVLNHTTISKEMKRDSELLYLKSSVKDYFTSVLQGDFDREKFEEHMRKFHPNYFTLKKKYFDPVEDFIEGVKTVDTNTIKGNMVEFTFIHKQKTLKKKFPKTTTFYNLKNLLIKLFKISGNYTFRIISGVLLAKLKAFNFCKGLDQVEKEDHSPDEIFDITDESKQLEDFNISDKDVILLF